MSFNLFGFSSKAFEQLIQAIAIHAIGPGIIVFGSGPDGGREAVFDGEIPYPFATDRWNGYGVVQAKCKEKTEGTTLDQMWALGQLRKELEQFVQSPRRERKPEYYVFATNVVLTPVGVTGGKDEANQLIESYYDKLPLKGHRIWDNDQINTFLDSFAELRQRFKAYLTTGDILSILAESLKNTRPDFESIALTFLDRQLRDDGDARLDQAGQKTDQRTSLAKVFVDLPIDGQPNDVPPVESKENLKPGFLRALIDLGSKKLDGKSIYDSRRDAPSDELSLWNDMNKWVLIGGPGSGKSTLSQFLAQVHRASILARCDPSALTPASKIIIQQTRELCISDGLPWPSTPRFPFRIELSAFARALASEKVGERVVSLLDYLTQRLRGDHELKVDDLRKWLSEHPWLVIFDGLDEVPSSSNRGDVCSAIQDFLSEASRANADVLILATTRPEGYNNEFGRENFEYSYLPPLSIERSLLYAKRFAETRYGQESTRVEEMINRLREASQDKLTAKLMQTPLQVTFMATVVATGGRPPRDRWKLFREYYDTIYKREQQKSEGDLRSVLDNHDTLIHRVHHDTGLLLQVHGENAGFTDAMMPLQQFRHVVRGYLEEDGWDDNDVLSIERKIVDEVRTRLVFLTSRIADKISFDVRSLQEYMAAECLMAGTQDTVYDRLVVIGPLSYWRNVVLFAAGACFAVPQMQHMRPLIRQLCDDMNDQQEDASLGLCHMGSRLALDLLEDGTVANTPIFARAFAKIALDALEILTPSRQFEARPSFPERIARIYDSKLDKVFYDKLKEYIGNSKKLNVTAWALLIALIGRRVEWAENLADAEWPPDLADRQNILRSVGNQGFPSKWLAARASEVVPRVKPNAISNGTLFESVKDEPSWLRSALGMQYHEPVDTLINVKLNEPLGASINVSFETAFTSSGHDRWKSLFPLIDMPNACAEWQPYIAAARFMQNPSKETLSTQIKFLAENYSVESFRELDDLPWPMQSCLSVVDNPSDLQTIATWVAEGRLGDTQDWIAAEKRWTTHGPSLNDFKLPEEGCPPFGERIAQEGFPCMYISDIQVLDENKVATTGILLELFKKNDDVNIKTLLRSCIFENLIEWNRSTTLFHPPIPFQTWKGLWVEGEIEHFTLNSLLSFTWPEVIDGAWLEFLNALGQSDVKLAAYPIDGKHSILPEQLTATYIANPNLHGILNILSLLAQIGYVINVPLRILQTSRFVDPRTKLSAVSLRAVQIFDEDKALSDEIVAIHVLHPKLDVIEFVSKSISSSKRPLPLLENLLLGIYHRLPESDHSSKSTCIEALLLLIRRRNSDLSEKLKSEELSLPWAEAEQVTLEASLDYSEDDIFF